MKYKFPKLDVGPAFDEMTGFHRGETPMAQTDFVKAGPNAMGISAKHNDGLKAANKAVDSEPAQYK